LSPSHALVLGVVQGLTEFLPISSSGHLLLVPWILGWPSHSLTFDVALHMGTLAALLVYFWRDLWLLVAAWLPASATMGRGALGLVGGEASEAGRGTGTGQGEAAGTSGAQAALERQQRRRFGLGLVVGSIPGAVIGALFASEIEASLRAPLLVALMMAVAAVLLAAADRAGVRRLGLDAIGLPQAAIIGLAQAMALAPGVSRSGVTLAAALFLGLTREAATRYVFLLGVPITAGAGIFQLRHLFRDGIPPDERGAFLLGITASLVVGLLAIGGMLRYVRHRSLDVFVGYRVVLAAVVVLLAVVRAL
jgi:undecaprenyl-diphosphatase